MKFLSRLGSVQKLIVPVVGIGALVIFATLFIYDVTQATVKISHDGETQTVKTHSNTVAELLEEVGIEVEEHDNLSNRMNETIENGMEINIQTANHVIILIDHTKHEFHTTADTLEELFQEQDISFSERDIVSHDLTHPIDEELVFIATTAREMTINDGGENITVWSTGESVSELFENNNISLAEHDRVLLGNEAVGEPAIRIIRVEKQLTEIEKTIPFKEEQQEDDTLAKGETKVIVEGKEGVRIETHEVTVENGKESDRSLVSEEVIEESENRIVAIGTKEPEVVTLAEESTSAPGTKKNTEKAEAPSNGKEFQMSATAYTANCSGCSGYTATGINLNANPNMKVIAVDPSVIPLGTKVWVEGYGYAVAGDTGGSITGNRIDVHVPTKEEAYSFGQRTVTVKIVE